MAPRGLGVVAEVRLATGARLCVSAGSVVDFGVGSDWKREETAIVNAANRGGLGGGGVDGAIGRAGGPALKADRRRLPLVAGSRIDRIATGGAALTGPGSYGSLAAGYVIHAVGPNYATMAGRGECLDAGDALLRAAYAAAMARARECRAKYVGFALLSAGVFRGPKPLEAVLDIAVASVAAVVPHMPDLEEVHLCAFQQAEQDCLAAALARLERGEFSAAPRGARGNSLHLRRTDSQRHPPPAPPGGDARLATPPSDVGDAPPPPAAAEGLLSAMDLEHRRCLAQDAAPTPPAGPGASLVLKSDARPPAPPPPAAAPPPPPPPPAAAPMAPEDADAVKAAMRAIDLPRSSWPDWAKQMDDADLDAALGALPRKPPPPPPGD